MSDKTGVRLRPEDYELLQRCKKELFKRVKENVGYNLPLSNGFIIGEAINLLAKELGV